MREAAGSTNGVAGATGEGTNATGSARQWPAGKSTVPSRRKIILSAARPASKVPAINKAIRKTAIKASARHRTGKTVSKARPARMANREIGSPKWRARQSGSTIGQQQFAGSTGRSDSGEGKVNASGQGPANKVKMVQSGPASGNKAKTASKGEARTGAKGQDQDGTEQAQGGQQNQGGQAGGRGRQPRPFDPARAAIE